jgi:hypothetical protein
MRTYASLTDQDFEQLVADLFGEEEHVRYEAFARGPDLGVDLRHEREDGLEDVVQCKHYTLSTVSSLISSARKERKRLEQLNPAPATYRFVTSRRLTRENKRTLAETLRPFVRRASDIWGEQDLEQLLARHDSVERRHIKLWLPSSAQLQAIVESGTHNRSRALVEEILEALPRWVSGRYFDEARAILRRERLCVIAGVPGIGKTTLARLLIADALDDRYEVVHISGDIEEAWRAYEPGKRQVFYYDDFLGRTALNQRLHKNEEDRLLMFMQRVARSETSLFVLTTREYILQQANELYEQLSSTDIQGRRFLLELDHYSRLDRARIFYNHAFFSEHLSREARHALVRDRAYETIIDHPAYNPRQIEWITGLSGYRLTEAEGAEYVRFAVTSLNDPARIWRHGFEHQLDDSQRAVLIALTTMPDRVEHDDLKQTFDAYCAAASLTTRGRAFTRALKVVDDSFVRSYQESGQVFVTAYSPAVDDFVSLYLAESQTESVAAVRGAVFFEQVAKLARVLDAPGVRSAELSTAFIEAFDRCWRAPSCSWYEAYDGSRPDRATPTRHAPRYEERISVLRAAMRWGGSFEYHTQRKELQRIYGEALQHVLAMWAAGAGESSAVVPLLRNMRASGEDVSKAIQAARAY